MNAYGMNKVEEEILFYFFQTQVVLLRSISRQRILYIQFVTTYHDSYSITLMLSLFFYKEIESVICAYIKKSKFLL